MMYTTKNMRDKPLYPPTREYHGTDELISQLSGKKLAAFSCSALKNSFELSNILPTSIYLFVMKDQHQVVDRYKVEGYISNLKSENGQAFVFSSLKSLCRTPFYCDHSWKYFSISFY